MRLAERLKHEREERKMSQSFVAKELDIPRQLLSSWELGKSTPDLEMIQLLSEFYDFSVDELLNNTPPKKATTIFLEAISKMASEDIIELLILGIGLPLIIFAIFF